MIIDGRGFSNEDAGAYFWLHVNVMGMVAVRLVAVEPMLVVEDMAGQRLNVDPKALTVGQLWSKEKKEARIVATPREVK
jgi:hypothetical protein